MEAAMDLAALRAFMAAEFPQVADEMIVDAADAHGVTLRLVAAERHLRPGGTISGPAMFGLADVAVYLAVLQRIGPVKLAVTTSASIDFMRKPPAGVDLLCTAEVLKLGRQLAVGDARIRAPGEEAVLARASMTYAIPPRR